MYAIVKTGGKQYRVQQGEWLLVERLAAEDGATVDLTPLLYVDGEDVVDGDDIARVTVQAKILGHERGPKLRIVKFKPKRGYKRRNGHRQELTRIEITSLKVSSALGGRSRAAADEPAPEPSSPAESAPGSSAASESSTATVEATNGS
jgi:large subunit ribosomal protein L21